MAQEIDKSKELFDEQLRLFKTAINRMNYSDKKKKSNTVIQYDIDTINKRMKKAVDEIEMMQNYDYAVVNDEVEKAAEKIKTIIRAERWRVKRFLPDYRKQLGELN